MRMHPCLLDDRSVTAWEDHATEQTFKGVIEVIGQMYDSGQMYALTSHRTVG
jgi:hypothetical protein